MNIPRIHTKNLPLLALILTILSSLFTHHSLAQPGQWTWMNGSSGINQPGVYGTLGTFAIGNTPPGLYEACEWTDHKGNFWLFGGQGPAGIYQDLWEFKPAINQWAWINGSGLANQAGNFGTQGVPSPTNMPPCRSFGTATWVDTAGDLWMFGGNGHATSNWGELNDLWRYHIATNEWTWMGGADTANSLGSYGTILVTAPSNWPRARCGTNAAWLDNNDKFWLFGGYVINTGTFSDLWKYDPAINQWTWMKGPNIMNQSGTYGALGIPAASNQPACRSVFAKWKDHAGNFFMYGGNKANFANLSDLWRLNPTTLEWTWMKGSNATNDTTIDNGLCLSAPTNHPGARYENRACWILPCDNFAFFGGASGAGGFNDLWDYTVSTNEWTLMKGTTAAGDVGSYGAITVSSPTNQPPNRFGSNAWTDTLGNLWMFGGETSPFYNDMWRFVRDTLCPYTPNSNAHSSFIDTPRVSCGSLTMNFHNTSTNGSYFYWNFGDGNTSSIVNPSHSYALPGTYYISLITMPSCFGSPDTARDTIIVHAFSNPIMTSTGPDTFCTGTTVTLNPGVYNFYNWSTGATTQTIIVDSSATYSVTVTDTNGCTAIASRTIVVLLLINPNASFHCDTTVGCSPFTVHFINTSNNASFVWHFGDGSTDTSRSPYHTYNAADSNVYSVFLIAKDSSACGVFIDTAFHNSYIHLNIYHPVADFSSNYTHPVYVGDTIHFHDLSRDFFGYLTLWQWTFNDGTISNYINPTHNWDLPGIYQVMLTVTDNNGCHDSTYYDYVNVLEGYVVVPNVFTPNNDGYNDLFEIKTSGMETYSLEIFDRWGVLQFESKGNHLLWDGYNSSGIQCPDGTYYYVLKAAGYSGKDFSKAGNLLLLR